MATSGLRKRWTGWLMALAACAPWPAHVVAQSAASSGSAMLVNATPAFPSQPNGKFTTSNEDLRVKVQGGYVRWTRDFDGNQWRFSAHWSNVKLEFDQIVIASASSGGGGGGGGSAAVMMPMTPPEVFGGTVVPGVVSAGTSFGSFATGPLTWIQRNGAYFRADSDYGSFAHEGGSARYLFRPLQQQSAVQGLPAKALYESSLSQFASGTPLLRWSDRAGDWIDFDKHGAIVAYGDKNDVKVTFEYEQVSEGGGNNVRRIKRVLDHFGNPALELVYDATNKRQLREVRDVPLAGDTQPARVVKYTYAANGSIETATDPRGHATTYGYDAKGRLTTITDAEGRVHRIEYGVTSRVAKEINAEGGETDYTYEYDKTKKEFFVRIQGPATPAGRRTEDRWYSVDGELLRIDVNGHTEREFSQDGRLVKYLNGRGVQSEFLRDEFDMLVSIKHGDGAQRTNTYESKFLRLIAHRDEAGVTSRLEYDDRGNLKKRTMAAGTADERVLSIVRDPLGRATSWTLHGRVETNGSTTPDAVYQFEYDNRGSVAKITDPEGMSTLYEYNRYGKLAKETLPDGSAWLYAYDPDGNLLTITSPLQNVETLAYDKVGNAVSYTDPRAKTSTRVVDAMDRVIRQVDPYGAAFETGYNKQGRIVSSRDAAGKGLGIDYDVSNRPVKAKDAAGFDYAIDYLEADGRDVGMRLPSRVRYPSFERQFQYNERNRPVRKTDLDGAEGRVENYAYDATGRRRAVTYANGKTYSYEFNPHGQVVKVTDPLGNAVRMTYDARGNVIALADPANRVTRFEYDRRDLLVRETDPAGKVTRFAYDRNGWATETVIATGQSIQFGHDADGRLTEQREYDAAGTLTKRTTLGYDANDNLTSWTDGSRSATLAYDDVGRLTSETVNYGSFSLSHAYTYHPNGQLKSYTGPDGVTVTYAYDPNGQLERVGIPGEGDIAVTDWQWVARKKVLLPGGTEQRFEYDGLLKMTRLKVVNPAQATVFELENRYGKMHEVAEAKRDGQSVTYTYDDALRLTAAQPAAVPSAAEEYTLDASGNRIADRRTGTSAWTYDAANQLEKQGSVSYSYDDAGRLVRKVDAALAEPRRTTTFVYDALSRLVEVRDGAGARIAAYAYDPFDRRLVKELGDGTRTHYLYSDRGLLAEADAGGQVRVTYGWHPEHEDSTYPMYARMPDPANGADARRYVYYHNDHLGTPQRITDKAGNLVWKADYDAFGKATVSSTPSHPVTSNLRFPGQYFDAETGLHYNDRRYYEPETGRYITRDPIGVSGGINLYAYAKHNPVLYSDPSGEIIPCLAINYLRCMAACMLLSTGSDIVLNCGDVNWGDNAKDCAVDCLWDMLPIPNPCGKLGKWVAGAMGAAAGLNSFTGDTLVHVRPAAASAQDALTAKTEMKRIADLRVGDEVLAWAEWKSRGDDAQVDRQLSYEKVQDIFSSHREQRLVHLVLDDGQVLTATEGHPFRTAEGWRDAILLKKGGQLLIKGSTAAAQERTATIADVRHETRKVPVFNLEVANAHTFFVGEQGALAHNGHGAYYITFDDGTWYAGKGDKDRMNKSMRDKTKGGKRKAKSCLHWPAKDDRDSFILEDMLIEQAGDIDDPNSLNQRNSPGRRMRGR